MSNKVHKRQQVLPNKAGKSADLARLSRQARDALAGGQVDIACQLLAPVRGLVASAEGRDLLTDALSLQAFERWDKPLRALASVERALEAAPADVELVRVRGSLLRRGGRFRASLSFLIEAHKLAPADLGIALESLLTEIGIGGQASRLATLSNGTNETEVGLAEGILAAAAGDLPKAEQRLATVRRPVAELLRGMVRLAKGEANAALAALRQSASDESLPAEARAYASFYCGLAHMRRRALQPAVEAFRQAMSLGLPQELLKDHLIWTYNQLVIDAVLEKDLASAADWLVSLSELGGAAAAMAQENVCYAWRLYGQEKARAGDWAEAARHWRKALEMRPHDFILRQNLAVALERADRGDEAIPHWHELVQQLAKKVGKPVKGKRDGVEARDDDDLSRHVLALAHRHLADLYLDEDETTRAIGQLERALDVLPDDVDAHFELARLLVEEGECGKAVGHLERVVAGRPDWVEGLFRLASVRYALSDFANAVAVFERAHALAPGDPQVRAGLGKAIARCVLSHPATFSAFDDARRAVSLLPYGESEGLIALAIAEFARGKRKQALQALRQCTREALNKARALIEVGHAYFEAGEKKLALDAWTRAMKKKDCGRSHLVCLSRAWAKAEDVAQCMRCLQWLITGWGRRESLDAVEEIVALPNGKTFLRKVLDGLMADRTNPLDEVFVVDCLLRLKDMTAARERVNKMALDAVANDDPVRIRFAIDRDYDYKPRLLERKTASAVAKWFDDHPDEFGIRDDF